MTDTTDRDAVAISDEDRAKLVDLAYYIADVEPNHWGDQIMALDARLTAVERENGQLRESLDRVRNVAFAIVHQAEGSLLGCPHGDPLHDHHDGCPSCTP
jgi:hypothetical protein